MTRKNEQKKAPQPVTQRLYNMEDAATYLGISRSSFIRNYKNCDKPLPTVTIGKREMYDVADLDRIIDRQKSSSQAG